MTQDVDGLTPDFTKVKVDGVAATAWFSGGPGSGVGSFFNAAWPSNTIGHAFTMAAGAFPGSLSFAGTIQP